MNRYTIDTKYDKEENRWYAHVLELDHFGEGNTEEEAINDLMKVMLDNKSKLENIKKLINLGWELEKGHYGIEDEDTKLIKKFNLSATTCSGDYTQYSNGTIISELWIEYTIYPNMQNCEYSIWEEGENPANCVPESDDFPSILEEALNNTLFKDIKFPKFTTIMKSDNKLRYAWYDLVLLEEDYTNSLGDSFEKGEYFIHCINNCNNKGEATIYYPIENEKAKELINKDIDDAVKEMSLIVEQFN